MSWSALVALVVAAFSSPGTAGVQPGAQSPSGAGPQPPVRVIVDAGIGPALATSSRQAVYVWNAERPGTVACTGECARVWPPVVVPSTQAVPASVRGVPGRLGTIRRPDGRLQLTWNRRPLYTYHDEPPGVVRCDNVDGWFAVRVPRS